MTRIEGWAREMLERTDSYGTLATINADGSPHQAVVWYLVRGDTLVVNSAVGRIWPANLRRDPRCSLLIEDGLDWVSVKGSVEAITDAAAAQADIATMARKYNADDPAEAARLIGSFEAQERITFVLEPERVIERRGG